MARCRCSGTTCGCDIRGGTGITVTGSGTTATPFIITSSAVDTSMFQTRDEKAVADGYAGLDASGKVPFSQTHITVAVESSPPSAPALNDIWIVKP